MKSQATFCGKEFGHFWHAVFCTVGAAVQPQSACATGNGKGEEEEAPTAQARIVVKQAS